MIAWKRARSLWKELSNRSFGRLPALALGAAVLALSALVARIALTSLGEGPDDEVLAAATQSSGNIVLGGRFSPNHLERLRSDGSVDPEFKKSWTTGAFNRPVTAVAVQPDDSIVVGGEFTSFDTSLTGYIARLSPDGQLDTKFANAIGTGFDDSVLSIQILSDQRILVAGRFRSFNGESVRGVARLNSDGTLDRSFPAQSEVQGAVIVARIDPATGKLLIGGEFESAGDLASYFRSTKAE